MSHHVRPQAVSSPLSEFPTAGGDDKHGQITQHAGEGGTALQLSSGPSLSRKLSWAEAKP